jgi:hypothetical protein
MRIKVWAIMSKNKNAIVPREIHHSKWQAEEHLRRYPAVRSITPAGFARQFFKANP